MYTGDLETTLQVYHIDLFKSVFNVFYSSVFKHTYRGKHNLSGYGVQEYNAVDVHEVTA